MYQKLLQSKYLLRGIPDFDCVIVILYKYTHKRRLLTQRYATNVHCGIRSKRQKKFTVAPPLVVKTWKSAGVQESVYEWAVAVETERTGSDTP